MTLHQLLLAIQANQPVNFAQVIKKLPAHLRWQQLFSVEIVSANKHRVTIKDNMQFELLLSQSVPALNRVEAAAHTLQDSHDLQCSIAYMLGFPQQNLGVLSRISDPQKTYTRPIPSVVLSEGLTPNEVGKLTLDFTPQRNAVLVENQECFFRWRELFSVLAIPPSLTVADIYFAGGKRALSPLFEPLLQQYDGLYCAFDYDLVGLQLMIQLKQKYEVPVCYLLPSDLDASEHLFTFAAKDIDTLNQMIQLANDARLTKLAMTVASTKHFMEQEALLNLVKPA